MQERWSLQAEWLAQRGYLFPWAPVCLAGGIGLYFLLSFEPLTWHFLWLGMIGIVLSGLGRFLPYSVAPIAWALVLMVMGFLIAGWRAHALAEPILGWRYYGPVEGRIVGIDRSSSDALRLTLDEVRLQDIEAAKTPKRIRIALHGERFHIKPLPGMWVMTTAHLSPPGGPVEPGGFDFQRHAWFLQIGAWGYTRNPVLVRAPPDGSQKLFTARMALSDKVQRSLPGERGAFAAAIMTGDRSGIGHDTLMALRVSNLAHLLAISGLHMGLLVGFVFAALRYGFALIPRVALYMPVKKIAAAIALVVAAGYLALSGVNVATERAFVMAAVALVAVMLDRRVLSLRAVAVAATIVLVLRPEALLGPGFQMSFAATTALVAAFGWLRDAELQTGPRWLRPFLAVGFSSFVAGAATAPVAAAHFNQIAHYGLIANILSVPLMGLLVMPSAVLSVLVMPLGLEGPVLWVIGQGVEWILGVAHWVSSLEGARGTVVSPGRIVLPLMAAGFFFLVLWRGRLRLAGLMPAAIAILLWVETERPDVLISEDGSLVGVMTPQGRALSRAKGAGFIAANWLENDGDASPQDKAAERWAIRPERTFRLRAVQGKKAAMSELDCVAGEWLVLNKDPPKWSTPALPCKLLHPEVLHETGALALYSTETGIKVISAREVTGARLWAH